MDDEMDTARARHDGVFVHARVGRREAGAGDGVERGGQEAGEDVLALEGARVVGEGYHLEGCGDSVDEGVGGEGAGLRRCGDQFLLGLFLVVVGGANLL